MRASRNNLVLIALMTTAATTTVVVVVVMEEGETIGSEANRGSDGSGLCVLRRTLLFDDGLVVQFPRMVVEEAEWQTIDERLDIRDGRGASDMLVTASEIALEVRLQSPMQKTHMLHRTWHPNIGAIRDCYTVELWATAIEQRLCHRERQVQRHRFEIG
jgi:hypothetical protein